LDKNYRFRRCRPLSFAVVILACCASVLCTSLDAQEPATPAPTGNGQTNSPAIPPAQIPPQQDLATITGTVFDSSSALVPGAKVRITRGADLLAQEAATDDNGQFSFRNIAPGAFQLTITAAGFATYTTSGTLQAGQTYTVPTITLTVATAVTSVTVGAAETQEEIAQEQLRVEESQRVLGFIPNFYVSYVADAAPLSPKQKFELAFRDMIDPVTIGFTAAVAGVEQANNDFREYGQGAQGYGKRFGANYADVASSTLIGSAILPSLLKQDPRYFYKGTGTTRERLLYALANAVICKGDNKRWQPNYSFIIGSLASGGISNLYYPANDRNGAGATFEIALIDIGEEALSNVFQEFVVRKFTPNAPPVESDKPQSKVSKLVDVFVHEGH
jgi:Carboxypeptidase regulatory-like domain